MGKLHELTLRHDFTTALPGEAGSRELPSDQPRQVREACYSFVRPEPMPAPELLAWSEDAAALFGLDAPGPRGAEASILAGSRLLPGSDPYAACYGGHQFGNWAGQLGDGRAMGLGEALTLKGEPWEFQLKGAGRTPYSRRGDGRAVLRSSVREFVCSEAMHHLGVPTTRALSVVTTGEEVVRDMFYDGNPRPEIGAVVCRLSPSFVRFGNFEIFASRNEPAPARRLADFVIQRYFSEIKGSGEDAYVAWYRDIVRRTAFLVSEWMRVGFVHGVMNTDNMSILGLTLDYGPYGWIESYDPSWTPNTTDLPGRRYAFGRQPAVAHWNLAQLARALVFLAPGQVAGFQAALDSFEEMYTEAFTKMMGRKLGLPDLGREGDQGLISELEALLVAAETDMTLFYRGLGPWSHGARGPVTEIPTFLREALYGEASASVQARWCAWFGAYLSRVASAGEDPAERLRTMQQTNPLYVPRNYLLQEAIDKAERGDNLPLLKLLETLRSPYEEQPGKEAHAAKRPEWARNRPGCSTLSCSS